MLNRRRRPCPVLPASLDLDQTRAAFSAQTAPYAGDMHNMRLSFLGGAGEVTGSCTLLESGDVRCLVDCGMFQGGHEAWAKNLAQPTASA